MVNNFFTHFYGTETDKMSFIRKVRCIKSLISKTIDPKNCYGVRYPNGYIMWLRYKNCPHYPNPGDYCWGLAVSYEEGNEKKFKNQHCPCEG